MNTRTKTTMRLAGLAGPAAAMLIAGCGHHEPSALAAPPLAISPAEHPTPQRVVKLRAESLGYIKVQAISPQASAGVVTAPGRVDFRAKAISTAGTVVAGRIGKIHVQIGDRVKAGDPLVTLASAEAAQMRSDFARAKVELARAEYRYQRQEEMKRSGVGLEIERMEAEAQLNEDRADYERARDALRLLGNGVAEEVVVRAPMDSTVLRAYVAAGATVAAGSALFDLGEPSSLWIVADVFEPDLLLVEKGAAASIGLASLPQPIGGHVVGESAAIQADMRRGQVFIEPDDPKTPLRPGMYARVSIEAAGPGHIVLPTTAILIKDGKQTLVYVETAEGVFEPREVQIGPARSGMTPILDGLKGGERVVVSGALLIDTEAAMLL
ncbi:efflux RND transporter periplasmic adaptor subunit [Methylomagnum ishizawai]|nr:efflux RND transporter periplasmic adaptor subunit [Methylomagnum ishizawai]